VAGEDQRDWVLPRRYGKYELLDRIGEGGMAEVYRSRLIGVAGFEKIVVIKRILPHLARRTDFVRMFVNEAKLAAHIQHKNVVQVFELGQLENGELYIAMEFVQGVDLRGILRNAAERRFRIPIWFTLHVVSEVLGALAHAHEFRDAQGQPSPVIHRDVTPANIFLSVNGEVKLADFGIAKAVGQSTGTEAGQVKGNVSYMSPEALLGEQLDGRADVFAAGVVLWECLTQHRLFQGRSNFETARAICDAKRDPPSRLNWKVPPELDALTLRTLGPERSNRVASARDFQAGLLEVLARLRPSLLPGQVKDVVEVILGRRPLDPRHDRELSAEILSDTHAAREPLAAPEPPKDTFGWLSPDLGAAFDQALAEAPWGSGNLPPVASVMGAPAMLPPAGHGFSGPLPPVAAPIGPVPRMQTRDMFPSVLPSPPSAPVAPAYSTRGAPAKVEEASDDRVPLVSLEEFMSFEPREIGGSAAQEKAGRVSQGPGAGFYIRYDDGNVVGPASYEELLKLCDGRAAAVSADRVRWMQVSTFSRLSGLDRLARDHAPLRKVTLVGRLEDRSIVSVFAQLGRMKATGKLVIMDTAGQTTARREIDVSQGAPAYVFADHPGLQLPTLLVQQKLITPEQSSDLVRQVLVRGAPLLDLISFQAFTDVNRVWPLLMRDRAVEIFRWRVGKFAFDAGAEVKWKTPFARSLHSLLFDSVYRGYTRDELTRLLEPYMNMRLHKTEGSEVVLRDMALTEKQAEIANRVMSWRTLGSIVKKAPANEALMLMVVAYILLESDVLRGDHSDEN
jgi:serine/threonine protein kinase